MGGRGASSASRASKSGILKKGIEAAPEEAVMRVNASNYAKGKYYQENCQRCVWAYEMQRRGYDVEALPSYAGDKMPYSGNWKGISNTPLTPEYVGANWFQPNSIKTEVTNTTNVMAKWGEGSRGIVQVAWKGGGGHVFNVEYKNGKVTAYDAQTGKMSSLNAALKDTKRGYTAIIRSDNVSFNDSQISKYVKTRGGK